MSVEVHVLLGVTKLPTPVGHLQVSLAMILWFATDKTIAMEEDSVLTVEIRAKTLLSATVPASNPIRPTEPSNANSVYLELLAVEP